MAVWRHRSLPPSMHSSQVDSLIESCDQTTRAGLRGRAMLILMALRGCLKRYAEVPWARWSRTAQPQRPGYRSGSAASGQYGDESGGQVPIGPARRPVVVVVAASLGQRKGACPRREYSPSGPRSRPPVVPGGAEGESRLQPRSSSNPWLLALGSLAAA